MIPWPCMAGVLRAPTHPDEAPPAAPACPRCKPPLPPYAADAFEPTWVQQAACALAPKAHGWEANLAGRAKKMGHQELAQALVQTRPHLCIFGHRRAHALLLREWMRRGLAPMAAYAS